MKFPSVSVLVHDRVSRVQTPIAARASNTPMIHTKAVVAKFTARSAINNQPLAFVLDAG